MRRGSTQLTGLPLPRDGTLQSLEELLVRKASCFLTNKKVKDTVWSSVLAVMGLGLCRTGSGPRRHGAVSSAATRGWGGRQEHSPLVLHNEPNGVADVPVLLMGAKLDLHPHLLLLPLNVLQRVLHQVTHRPVLPRVQRLDVLEDVKHLQDKTERLGDNIFI